MSHFTVLVLGEKPEQQLAPYQENNMGDCPQKYLRFNDQEAEFLKEYKTESSDRVQMPDGRLLMRWDEEFRTKGTGLGSDTHEVPKHLKIVKVRFNKLYKTFEEFVADWHSYKKRDDKKKRYGYWENPQKKWDWHQLGGRWTGFFKLRVAVGAVGRAGTPGILTEPAKEGYADQAYKRLIDFDGMRYEAGIEASKTYQRLERLLGGEIKPLERSWKALLGGKYKSLSVEERRAIYHAQGPLKALEAARRKATGDDGSFLAFLDYEQFVVGHDAYVKRARDGAVSTFAVVKDGKWYERGEMGWWGCVSNEKDADEWQSQFTKLLDKTPDDTLLSVFDCHI